MRLLLKYFIYICTVIKRIELKLIKQRRVWKELKV